MTTTTGPCKRRLSGFTLTEVLVAFGLVSIVMTALFSSWGFIARSTLSISNYTEMNSAGRMGLEIFARDVRTARAVAYFSETSITLEMESNEGPRTVHYEYDPASGSVIRRSGSERVVAFSGVEELLFTRYTVLRNEAMNDLETKLIQLELRMSRPVLNRDTTKKIVSARYIMRNKRVST